MWRVRLLLPLFLTAVSARAQEPTGADRRIHHFLNRFTLGATPELVAEVKAKGIRFWLDAQLAAMPKENPGLAARLADFDSLEMTNRDVMNRYVRKLPPNATIEQIRKRNRERNIPRNQLRDSVVLRGVYSTQQVREVAADFWRNHFCVAVDKGRVRYYANDYEREVIRACVFGKFGTMLYRSAKHPAMLVYLDNVLSRRPPTKAELKKIEMRVRLKTKSKGAGQEAADIAAQRGLNENYGRELLELHTLGVDNYYTQRDVENVAKALTGWTVSSDPDHAHEFQFREDMHILKDKVFLNRRIPRDRDHPIAEGERVLDMLIAHPGTAHFISWKLCRYFVNDDPPADLVDRVAHVFTESSGDLPTLYRAIVMDPEFFKPRNYRAKFKRPFEFVVSALRVTKADVKRVAGIHKVLKAMSEDIYLCKDPTGYYDQAEAWRDPGAFAIRWKFAHDLVLNKVPGVTVPATLYDGLEPANAGQWKQMLVDRLIPGGIGDRTSGVIDRMVAAHLAKDPLPKVAALAPQIAALILGSPEFQEQ